MDSLSIWDPFHKFKDFQHTAGKRESEAQKINPFTLATLPTEIIQQIFSYLDACSSVCLGLATKRLYSIHMFVTGIVDLNSTPSCIIKHTIHGRSWLIADLYQYGPALKDLLKAWAGPEYHFCRSKSRFVRAEKAERINQRKLVTWCIGRDRSLIHAAERVERRYRRAGSHKRLVSRSWGGRSYVQLHLARG
jgi:hypothetical protein